MALKDIKTKIKATERTHKVTRAMEAVSAVKMRKTQETALKGRFYARAALSILTRVAGTEEVKRHPLAHTREGKKIALVLITSDKGLAGALNSSVIKRASEALIGREIQDVVVYAYGKKGEEYFRRRGYEIRKSFENKADGIPLSIMQELSDGLSQGFLRGDYDKVITIYSNFKSTFEQVATVRRLLPLSLGALTEIVEGIVPHKGKWSTLQPIVAPSAYSIEPDDGSEVLNRLVPRLIAISLYHMLLEAKASEHSSRMVAMKNASDKSKEVAHDLKRLFNKIRQAGITREVSEIVSGREALAT
ncbi:ATP synthase F1 subunit gamma [Candidatus Kaiserbacteria bacterium]|nr:ATP synthase F1 subunit gamma [Candidatus Kaiserbacteria bacterium]